MAAVRDASVINNYVFAVPALLRESAYKKYILPRPHNDNYNDKIPAWQL